MNNLTNLTKTGLFSRTRQRSYNLANSSEIFVENNTVSNVAIMQQVLD